MIPRRRRVCISTVMDHHLRLSQIALKQSIVAKLESAGLGTTGISWFEDCRLRRHGLSTALIASCADVTGRLFRDFRGDVGRNQRISRS